jgi:hypothetical protein
MAKSDEIVGHLKALVDGYMDKYDKEVARFTEADANMAKLVNSTTDPQARERAVDEKLKLKAEHEEELRKLTDFVRSVDSAVQAVRPGDDWKDGYPDLKARVAAIYDKNPVLLTARTARHSSTATAPTDLPASMAKSDELVGHLKSLVDGYLGKYNDEVARFTDADAAMAKLVDSSSDPQARERSVDERLREKGVHEETLEKLTGLVRSLDSAVQASRPGDDWKDAYPDLKEQVSKIYDAYPVFLAKGSNN